MDLENIINNHGEWEEYGMNMNISKIEVNYYNRIAKYPLTVTVEKFLKELINTEMSG